MRIDFKKPQKTLKKNEFAENDSDSSKKILDKKGNLITNPNLLAELHRIDSLQKKTVRDYRRQKAILKYGDNANSSVLAKSIKNNTPQQVAQILAEITQLPQETRQKITAAKIRDVIAGIESGDDPVAACKKNNISYKKFLEKIESDEFSDEKADFLRARTALADFYIYKLNILQEKLINGEIDNCTYSAITRDLLYLAGKFAPATFGDKISFERKEKIEVTHTVDQAKIAALNKLLAPNIKEAEFEEL